MGKSTPDPDQYAYGTWWTKPSDDGDPEPLDPQPDVPPPSN